MVRHSSSLSRLVPLALLLVVGSCSHARSRPSLADREAQCAPVWKAVHAEIDSRGAACSADWECREVRPEYLGCDAWANVGFKLSEGRIVELENACAPISFVPDCGARVGACVMGRCAGRATRRDGASCRAAKLDLERRLVEATRCRNDGECGLVWANGLRGVGPSTWQAVLAPEIHLVGGACRPSDWDPLPDESLRAAACVKERCVIAAAKPVHQVAGSDVELPELVDRQCLEEALRLPGNSGGNHTQAAVRFVVSERGVPFAFRFEGIPDRHSMYRIAEDLSRCAFQPPKLGGEAIKGIHSYRLPLGRP